MNVDPVPTSAAGIDRQTPERKLQAKPSLRTAISENVPKPESAKKEISPSPSLFPEHEVKVQLDTQGENTVVYQVLDKQSGNLVLQVPSAEELRGRHQSHELLQRIASRGKVQASESKSSPVVNREEINDGSKF